jgi:hypothetical protein
MNLKMLTRMGSIAFALACSAIQAPWEMYPFPDNNAIHMDSPLLVGWADGYESVVYGSDVDAQWRTPHRALGKALGTTDDVVSLGGGGQITMTFSRPIIDDAGYDFAIFENGFNNTFLELCWVEVSSDGIHFCRFPNYVNNEDTERHVAQRIYGLASKYEKGLGMPFDLTELQDAYNACFPTKPVFFSAVYANALTENFPYLDLNHVTHVRIIDIVGDGIALDTFGQPIFDPTYLQIGSAGFDLDAIGVLNQIPENGITQSIVFNSIPHQRLAFQLLELSATADSGLPVVFSLQSGNATVSNNVIYFTGTGTVEVVASQPGDATYAPAAPVLRSFVVAEEIQHIFVEPVPNQIRAGGTVQLHAYSNSGLPVKMQVQEATASVWVGEDSHLLDLGSETGAVTLRAFQPGNAATAPAEDVLVHFQIVESGDPAAPVPLGVWLETHTVPDPAIALSTDVYGRPAVLLDYPLDPSVLARSRILQSLDLQMWTNAVPEIVEMDSVHLVVRVEAVHAKGFYRLQFEGQ